MHQPYLFIKYMYIQSKTYKKFKLLQVHLDLLQFKLQYNMTFQKVPIAIESSDVNFNVIKECVNSRSKSTTEQKCVYCMYATIKRKFTHVL